jgi:hypothetical protein
MPIIYKDCERNGIGETIVAEPIDEIEDDMEMDETDDLSAATVQHLYDTDKREGKTTDGEKSGMGKGKEKAV